LSPEYPGRPSMFIRALAFTVMLPCRYAGRRLSRTWFDGYDLSSSVELR
jgi:hypothetical protein